MPEDALPETIPESLPRAADGVRIARSARRRTRAADVRAAGATRPATTARALIASGVEAGDRVAIWAPNTTEWVLAALGVYRAGAVVVPLNTRFKGDEAAYILDRAQAKLLFTVTDFLDTDYVACSAVGDTRAVAREDRRAARRAPARAPFAWDAFLARRRGRRRARDRSAARLRSPAARVSDIIFTSGTTGRRRARCSRTARASQAYDAWTTVVGLRHGDRYLIVNPFFHSFGLKAGILACLINGATIVPHAVFDVDAVMQRVADERDLDAARAADDLPVDPRPPARRRVRPLHAPPRGHRRGARSRSSWSGACATELSFETIVTGYGLTEATGIATMCRHDDDPETISKTVGPGDPRTSRCTWSTTTATRSPRGEPGEVVVRGYNVMQGFVDDPEGTAEAIDADGWLHTGDVGVIDERGNLRITDRKKDMFIVGGFNAYPAEIENMI